MPWFPVDDAFHSHPKARKAGDEAVGMWARAGSHCMAYLTDGFVADWWVKQQPKGVAKANKLVAAGLWSRAEKDGEPGYQFHDWKPECMKTYVLGVREKARQRKAKSRESQQSSRVTDSVTDGERNAAVLGYTQPNPTQPINPLVDSGGGVTQVTACDLRPECPDHEENSDTACRKCMRRREWDEAHERSQRDDELARRRNAKERADNCPICHGTNWIPDTDPAIRCPHQEVSHA